MDDLGYPTRDSGNPPAPMRLLGGLKLFQLCHNTSHPAMVALQVELPSCKLEPFSASWDQPQKQVKCISVQITSPSPLTMKPTSDHSPDLNPKPLNSTPPHPPPAETPSRKEPSHPQLQTHWAFGLEAPRARALEGKPTRT